MQPNSGRKNRRLHTLTSVQSGHDLLPTENGQPWTPTVDTDNNDNVQNVQLSRNIQPGNLSSPLSTVVNSRSVHPLAASEDYSTSNVYATFLSCLLYTSPSPRDRQKSRMPSSA